MGLDKLPPRLKAKLERMPEAEAIASARLLILHYRRSYNEMPKRGLDWIAAQREHTLACISALETFIAALSKALVK